VRIEDACKWQILTAPMLQLDRTSPHICSAAELVPFQAALNGTANSPRCRSATASIRRCGARSSA